MKFLLLNSQLSIETIASIQKKDGIKNPWAQPLGLLYIAGILEHEGHNVEIIDLTAENINDGMIKKSLSFVDAVGISVDSFAYNDAVYITKKIKQIDQNIPIIIGEPHCTYYPEKSLIDIPNADISVEGEGEQVIKNIIKNFQGKKPLSEIPGIRYRIKNKIQVGKPPEIITNLDAIPFPSRHLVEKYNYGKFGKKYLYKPKFTSLNNSWMSLSVPFLYKTYNWYE